MEKKRSRQAAVVGCLVLTLSCAMRLLAYQSQTDAEGNSSSSYVFIPSTVSPRAQEILRQMTGPATPPLPGPNDIAGWQKIRSTVIPEDLKKIFEENEKLTKAFTAATEHRVLGGVPVVDVRPNGWKENGKILLYTHGGGYVTGGPDSSVNNWVADRTGLRIISIGYTLAPESKWDHTTDQVIAVFEALKKQGYKLKNMALFGDSAGGGLAAGSVLKMRDKGLGMPSAVVLWSPWADITETGDTYVTLKKADPILDYPIGLKGAADAYADPKDQKNPYVSPVYGDYSKGYPPTLIQGGTKEIFLSDFIREYRAIDSAGGTAVLDIYEGMPHVFQAFIFGSPESEQAMTKMKKFLAEYMGK